MVLTRLGGILGPAGKGVAIDLGSGSDAPEVGRTHAAKYRPKWTYHYHFKV